MDKKTRRKNPPGLHSDSYMIYSSTILIGISFLVLNAATLT